MSAEQFQLLEAVWLLLLIILAAVSVFDHARYESLRAAVMRHMQEASRGAAYLGDRPEERDRALYVAAGLAPAAPVLGYPPVPALPLAPPAPRPASE